jgi:nucleotide-binding universal stress UspA family protein
MDVQKILIAVDDSKYSDNAAACGFDLAHFYKAQVGLVNIMEPIVTTNSDTDLMTGTPFATNLTNDAEFINVQKEASENIIQRIIKSYAGDLQVSNFAQYGSTAESIVGCAIEFNADLIVIGTHNRAGISRLLLGSVAADVIRLSIVPVLVVPFRESESPQKSE